MENKYKSVMDKLENEIGKDEAKRLLMDLLESYDFTDSTPEYKARCFTAVFYALELMKD